jgi:thioredoxin 1
MPTRRRALRLAALLTSLVAVTGASAGMRPFGTANFQAALEAGGPVLVHIDATWCPTCQVQKPIIAGLLSQKEYMDVTAFTVDYDAEKAFMRQINTPDRSTIVVFRDGKEVARGTGDTTEAKIEALLKKAVQPGA